MNDAAFAALSVLADCNGFVVLTRALLTFGLLTISIAHAFWAKSDKKAFNARNLAM